MADRRADGIAAFRAGSTQSGTSADSRLRVVVVLAHPRGRDSLAGALAAACARGARAAGAWVETIDLDRIPFDPHVTHPSPADQALEPDLEAARQAIGGADHIVFVYPTWWGTYPALLKGFLDRVLLPGWAFEETTSGTGFEGRLGGRTAELLTTMDTPGPVYSLVYRSPGRNALARATLGFCGIEVVRHTRFGPVNTSNAGERQAWLAEAEALGRRLENGPRTISQRVRRIVSPWLTALRLQFYPMTFFAYWLGALLAERAGFGIDAARFWAGYAMMFSLEAATVFVNELVDVDSDRQNRFWGPFNGGSRVLDSGALTPRDLRRGVAVALGAAVLLAVWLVATAADPLVVALFIAASGFLALSYTLPPLRLSYRTLGEIDVGLTHSFLAILAGYLIQNGPAFSAAPWLVGLPLFLSILPAIILSGVPDRDADAAAEKRTIAVAFGIPAALAIAAVLAPAAAAAMIGIEVFALPGTFGLLVPVLAVLHAAWLVARLVKERRKPPVARRIDATMVGALSFILWFCIPPLLGVAG